MYFGKANKGNWKMLTSQWVNKSASDVTWPVVPPAALLLNTAGPGQQREAKNLDANDLPSSIKIYPTDIRSNYRKIFF